MSPSKRQPPDQVLVDITDYALDYKISSPSAIDAARLCLIDSLACAFYALQLNDCTKLLGPLMPGIVASNAARVPGTSFELDPVTAAFNFGSMLRWLDFNDTFTAVQGSHPSDNLAGILMLADYLNRQRPDQPPVTIAAVLESLVKAHEIQGCIALENDFNAMGIDHPVLTRVASAAVLTRMLGGNREQVMNAVSNAWIDTSLGAYRNAPNAGSRKGWAAADAVSQAMRLAFMAVRGEMGYPSVLTAKHYGFYDARFGGKPFKFQRPYGEYIIQHTMFKLVSAGMHSQSAVECAFRLHPLVQHRLADIQRVQIETQSALMRIMNKSGPLHNAADRDHCVQYIVALGLLHGRINPADFEDEFAADPRIDALRDRMTVTEHPRFSKDFYDKDKRSSANAVQVVFKDGTSTPREEIEYPVGHPRRRSEFLPVLERKFAESLKPVFSAAQRDRILASVKDSPTLDRTPVHAFVDLFVV